MLKKILNAIKRINQDLKDEKEIEEFTDKVTFYEDVAGNQHFYKKGNLVFGYYQGEVSTHAVNDQLFLLPDGYRPKSSQSFYPCVVNSSAYGVALIESSGLCKINFISSTSASGRVYFSFFFVINN